MDRTCMSYWFPKIEAAGLPVPRTVMVPMPGEAFKAIYAVFDGKPVEPEAEPFLMALGAAADGIGYPCFLRTGQTSGKHDWENTCYLPSRTVLREHVIGIVEYGEMATLMGLPCDWWAVREMLPTLPITTCPAYGNMPVCREFRVFVDDGSARCWHPYWPMDALERGGAAEAKESFDALCSCADLETVLSLARRAGEAAGGSWSVDMIETSRGWFVTDMAEAEKSFHWPGCEHNTALVEP